MPTVPHSGPVPERSRLFLHPSSRFVRYVLPFLAVAAVFSAGYVAGHQGFGGPADRISVVRAASKDDTAALAASGETTAARTVPAGRRLPTRLSPMSRPVELPRQKRYDLKVYAGKVIVNAPFRTKRIALTFDDGPSENTEAILGVLRQHHAAATFFFVGGRMVGREGVVLDVVRQGSEVANHTWTHTSFVGVPAAEVERQILTTQEEILRTTGIQNEFIRPRAGKYDDVALGVIRKLGLTLVGWDAYGHDTFNDGKTVSQIESFAVQQSRGGSIVLFHEVNPATVKALPGIIRRLEGEGYEFVTLADLLSSP